MIDPFAAGQTGKAQIQKIADYEVKPLECWGRLKELRRKHAREIWTAKKEGKIAILGLVDQISALVKGLGDVAVFTLGPHFGRIMDNEQLARQCCEATEARGFGPDTCATLRTQLGSIYLGFHNLSRDGDRVPLDFCLEIHLCVAQSKIAREMSDHYNIPFFMVEIPAWSDPASQTYLVEQMDDAIRWMEKVTGRKYDDEKLIQATYTEWKSRVLWARVLEQNKNIPAPLDLRMTASISVMLQVAKTSNPEICQFLGGLLAEVKDRAANKIAAVGVERVRLAHEGQWPQFACGSWAPGVIMRLGVPYGAIFVAARNAFNIYGAWQIDEDGSWHPINTLEEMGVSLKDRGDALKALAQLFTEHSLLCGEMQLTPRTRFLLGMVKDWHIDGVIFNLDRSCHGVTPTMNESRLALQQMGVPTAIYEASYCDPREFDRTKVQESLESFFESLGLAPASARL